jgi:membrane associated rhomboid family serine protease
MNRLLGNKILLFSVAVCIINALMFLYIDKSDYTFNLSLAASQPWRFITFQFFHVDIVHLMENVIGLLFVALIATELDIKFGSFLKVYLLSIFAVFLPISIVFPMAIVAGNSTGLYGLLALCLIKARKFVSSKVTLPIIVVLIFSMSALNLFLCGMCFLDFFQGEFFHFSGFLAGIGMSFMPAAKPRRMLRI